MKIIKKCLLGLAAVGLTVSLSACGNGNKDSNEGEFGMSNVLNSKKMIPIVVTNTEDESVSWAGFIGKGKVKAMYLDGMTYDYGYKDLKKLNNDEFNESIVEMGKDFEPHPRKYVTSKTNVQLTTSSDSEVDENKTEKVSLDFLNNDDDPKISSVKDIVSNPVYSKVLKKTEGNEWATLKAFKEDDDTKYNGYEMHIKLGKNPKSNLKMEDAEKAEKDYDNVKVDENEENEI